MLLLDLPDARRDVPRIQDKRERTEKLSVFLCPLFELNLQIATVYCRMQWCIVLSIVLR